MAYHNVRMKNQIQTSEDATVQDINKFVQLLFTVSTAC